MDEENDSFGPLTMYITFESELHTKPSIRKKKLYKFLMDMISVKVLTYIE